MKTSPDKKEKMPVVFIGHGSPMNAIEENDFVAGFRKVASETRKPLAILCISAHWQTRGTRITAMKKPKTIHDFGGFPAELYQVQYPAPGNPELALNIKNQILDVPVEPDFGWGLDHGTWSVVRHMYPQADVPVLQMSLDYKKSAMYHYELGKELAKLRHMGILIIGSGNMVHNLRLVAWDKINADNYAFDWATEANETIKKFILDNNYQNLIDYKKHGKAFELAIPTPEHYLPLLYIMALKDKDDNISLFNDKSVAGSLSMTSVKIGDL